VWLKPVLRLMSFHRLRIEEINADEVVTSYTRWVESAQVKGSDNPEVYLTLSPRFERVWLETKKQLPEYVSRNRPMPNETEHDGKDLQLLFYGLLFPGVGGSFSGFASGKYSVSIRNFSYCSW
jgi:hypothetical protein